MSVKRKQKPVFRRIVKHKNPRVLKKIAIALAIVLVATFLYVKFLEPHTLEAKQTLKLQSTQQQLKSTLQRLETTKSSDVKQQQSQDEQIQQLQKQLQDTQQQLQAKAAQKAQAKVYADAPPSVTYSPPADGYKAYIYAHESGNNPGSINAGSGACGLGQALPCSKMPCSLSDYACQDAYFTNYAMVRYGSWEAAYNFWVANHWW